MSLHSKEQRINEINNTLSSLSANQLTILLNITKQFQYSFIHKWRNPDSDIISEFVLSNFGDILRLHHCFSSEPFTKDKFEYALIRSLKESGVNADKAPTGNPGHDVVVNRQKISLKTQADRNIKKDKIHISKFMELGKDEWGNNESDLETLRNSFFSHMKNYSRIFTLRCLAKYPKDWHYELVEIPKSLLEEAAHGKLEMKFKSSQFPKPGYCYVYASPTKQKFQLYFDGGSERKLQIKNLLKEYCTVHGVWIFPGANLLEQ
ncbi:hypothetical protein ACT6NV_06415 [Robiginitalea sp. IMCC44478]|uniref:hypothetical protein n=1 Tax=Robiginitalea sp. IMCC44478 TaxID=3459122 RepID=UPI0040411B4C